MKKEITKKVIKELREYFDVQHILGRGYVGVTNKKIIVNNGLGIKVAVDLTERKAFEDLADDLRVTQLDGEYENAIMWCEKNA